ncbi:AAA family ATPase [Campylobacter sp. RM16187]|uniref:AAA family ATPase n=1 Tax=Campylobacter sp. RM16187 TaxID=1660063 RepID=UPI0021B5D4CE|nr:AAA family ATPase [Campylobacter sp. RM16187]QKG28923.1 putative ATPase [Campylobacter sp. RM16187]
MVKCSFNNFKAFGKHPQKFSSKPITLVYGPNSSGKSSFLHSIIYREHLLNNGNTDLQKTGLGGDEIDFGGFKNFIHKHNTKNILRYTYEFMDKETIQYILYYKYTDCFSELNNEFNSESFLEKINPRILFDIIKEKDGLKKLLKDNKNLQITAAINVEELHSIISNSYGIEKIEIEIRTGIDHNYAFYKKDIVIIINSEEYAHLRSFYDNADDVPKNLKTIDRTFLKDRFLIKLNKNHPFVKTVKENINYNESYDTEPNLYNQDKMDDRGYYLWSLDELKYKNIYSVLKEFDKSKGIDVLLGDIALCIFEGFNGYRFKQTIQYYSPLRFYPERKDLIFDNFSNHRDDYKPNSSKDIWGKIVHDEYARKKLNAWLYDEKKLKSSYKIEVEKFYKFKDIKDVPNIQYPDIQELKFLDLRTGVFVSPRDMGLGISQSLPILASCFTLYDSSIFIEQPELHLHPAVQCEIADEFIKSKNNNRNDFFIETHSEHILLRIMRRLRYSSEGKINKGDELYITPEDICLLYVDNNGEDTYIKELELDVDGTLLDPWPNGFFEEGYKERFE